MQWSSLAVPDPCIWPTLHVGLATVGVYMPHSEPETSVLLHGLIANGWICLCRLPHYHVHMPGHKGKVCNEDRSIIIMYILYA